MATQEDVRRIASTFPGAKEDGGGRFGFHVEVKGKAKGFVWSWLERVQPKKPRVVNDSVVGIRTPDLATRDLILSGSPVWAVDDPHYANYPAVVVRLADIGADELEDLLLEAWRTVAPRERRHP